MAETTHYLNRKARKMKPTRSHRPAVWEMMLGTVQALNDDGEAVYFDYKHDEAFEFSGYSEDRDPRIWKYDSSTCGHKAEFNLERLDKPRMGQLVLWIK